MKRPEVITDQHAAIGRSVTPRRTLHMLDLFCGGGGTSAGAMEAAEFLGYAPRVIGVNHWDQACETWMLNHPDQPRPLCTGVDAINPRDLYRRGDLDLLWASPECTHHSNARGGMPINDQSRATAWCVLKFMDALSPAVTLIENVPEFQTYGPLMRVRKQMADGSYKRVWRPDPRRRGETFQAICNGMEALGCKVEVKVMCAADYGDPTSRRRLFIQAVRGRRKVTWPDATHGARPGLLPWVPAREIVDWSLDCPSIYGRKRPLSPKTMQRIWEGLQLFGLAPSLICMEHEGAVRSIERPAPTTDRHVDGSARSIDDALSAVSTSGAHHALIEPHLLPQQSDGRLRPVSEPCPTVAAAGAIALVEPFLVKYYGTGRGASIHEPLDTVTAKERFALCKPLLVEIGEDRYMLDIGFRMLKAPELALAQGFRKGYRFAGNQTEAVAQIGNAVPRRLSRALVAAAWSQRADVTGMLALP